MNKNITIKEKIVEVTMELMKKSEGDVSQITTRAISEKANVGIGLINYHFQSKDKLIALCVQRFISESISTFRPDFKGKTESKDKILESISSINQFLIHNMSVSKISIIQDHMNPLTSDNTIRSLQGIKNSLNDFDASDFEKNILTFALVSFVQNVFLRKDQTKELFGFDYDNDEQRNATLALIISRLFSEK